jgi:hypothetical protein
MARPRCALALFGGRGVRSSILCSFVIQLFIFLTHTRPHEKLSERDPDRTNFMTSTSDASFAAVFLVQAKT